MNAIDLLHAHVERLNAGVRSGDYAPMLTAFTSDAELVFEGIPIGPFGGRDGIAAAYETNPPDDEVLTDEAREEPDGTVVAPYRWAREPDRVAGEMRLTPRGDRIARLVVTFVS
jgi:steroid Delta-isomerase